MLEQLVRRVLAAAPDEIEPPSIVGASCTTPVDLTAGSVSPHLIAAWTAFPLREYLEDLTGLPVVLDTAASALAAGERWVGDATHVDSFLTLVVDVTVESAVTIGGVAAAGSAGQRRIARARHRRAGRSTVLVRCARVPHRHGVGVGSRT